jgi:hypothetical protein
VVVANFDEENDGRRPIKAKTKVEPFSASTSRFIVLE